MSTSFPATAVPTASTAPRTADPPDTIADARLLLANVYGTIRGHVQHVGATAGNVLGRLGSKVETFVGAKIKRRVKPPIIAAIVVAGLALAVAAIALSRK